MSTTRSGGFNEGNLLTQITNALQHPTLENQSELATVLSQNIELAAKVMQNDASVQLIKGYIQEKFIADEKAMFDILQSEQQKNTQEIVELKEKWKGADGRESVFYQSLAPEVKKTLTRALTPMECVVALLNKATIPTDERTGRSSKSRKGSVASRGRKGSVGRQGSIGRAAGAAMDSIGRAVGIKMRAPEGELFEELQALKTEFDYVQGLIHDGVTKYVPETKPSKIILPGIQGVNKTARSIVDLADVAKGLEKKGAGMLGGNQLLKPKKGAGGAIDVTDKDTRVLLIVRALKHGLPDGSEMSVPEFIAGMLGYQATLQDPEYHAGSQLEKKNALPMHQVHEPKTGNNTFHMIAQSDQLSLGEKRAVASMVAGTIDISQSKDTGTTSRGNTPARAARERGGSVSSKHGHARSGSMGSGGSRASTSSSRSGKAPKGTSVDALMNSTNSEGYTPGDIARRKGYGGNLTEHVTLGAAKAATKEEVNRGKGLGPAELARMAMQAVAASGGLEGGDDDLDLDPDPDEMAKFEQRQKGGPDSSPHSGRKGTSRHR